MQKPPKPPGIVLPSADFTKNSRSIGGSVGLGVWMSVWVLGVHGLLGVGC